MLHLASLGYMVLLPDGLGYGDTQTANKPFFLKHLTAVGAYDMLAAVRWQFPDTAAAAVTLIGSSQGNYTAAAHKYLARTKGQPSALWAAPAPFAVEKSFRGYFAYLQPSLLTQEEEKEMMMRMKIWNKTHTTNRFNAYFDENMWRRRHPPTKHFIKLLETTLAYGRTEILPDNVLDKTYVCPTEYLC